MATQEIDSIVSDSIESNHDENTPLVPVRTWSWLATRYGASRKCVTSNAALLILTWSFVVGLISGMLIPSSRSSLDLLNFVYDGSTLVIMLPVYSGAVIITCFFPLAGILADIKFGRHKTVVTSLFILLLAIVLASGVAGIITLGLIYDEQLNIAIMFSFLECILVIMLLVGLIGFTANVVQFGMDQLHDSPAEDSTLFIHWYVWTYYASIFLVQLTIFLLLINYNNISLILLALIPVVVVMVLAITLCLVRRRRRWFLIEPGGLNPYKLVYRVTKFARQHKIPVQRSAFTYCEDELPSGLDLGKEKYGGCFTTEQVEDVKAFYGIIKVLFSSSIVFLLNFAADSNIFLFARHIAFFDTESHISQFVLIMIASGLLPPLLVVICIPLYLCLLRPFISQYVPGMLKRMGLGMFFVLLSLMASFSMDLAVHLEDEHNNTCMFHANFYDHSLYLAHQNPALLLIQFTLSALSNMLIYTAVFEFICSQSPHSMKGMLIGLLYAIRGLYQLFATILVLPFVVVEPFTTVHHISCGFWYYLINIVIGVVALLVYTCVAKRYRYRVRDELCNFHQYAENYYSNQQYREEIVTSE